MLVDNGARQAGAGLVVAMVVQCLLRRKPGIACWALEGEVLGQVCRHHMASNKEQSDINAIAGLENGGLTSRE